MQAHSKFSPSSMGRLMQCPGSLELASQYPQEPNPAAEEGSLAHAVAGATLCGEPLLDADITDEMRNYAEQYAAIVVYDPLTHIEEWVDCSCIHPDCFGTPDVYKVNRDLRLVQLWDYKYGRVPVEVKTNWQLITYALGIKTWLDLSDKYSFQLGIFQPRAPHRDGIYRTITLSGSELMAYLPVIQGQIKAALEPNAQCKVGPLCMYCPAAGHCETLAVAATSIFEWLQFTNQPFDLDPQFESAELIRLQSAKKLLDARIMGVEQSIIGGLKSGKQGYAHTLEQGEGREVWSCSDIQVKMLGNLFGVQLVVEKPITPKQAIAKKIPAEVVHANSVIPKRELKLVVLEKMFDK